MACKALRCMEGTQLHLGLDYLHTHDSASVLPQIGCFDIGTK